MLIKEYRIPLPLTVQEYKIAQLYMIAKKSREESKGAGSGVEIIVNEPYSNGPGGNGQYTHKIYHVGSHLPGWFKSLLPKSALMVKEEAWNAYPYTKTRYTCPFVEKFSIEIETYYFPDNGYQDNVFKLSGSDLRNRVVDVIDIVKDQLTGADYVKEEDPTLYVSEKTGRGPLSENWLEEYWADVKGKAQPTQSGKSLMCAYKLCRVEFRYWGMQTKLEKFIQDIALRKTMVRAHRQAWAWQDEWNGLTIEDIREIERQTQLALQATMGQGEGANEAEDGDEREEQDSERVNATITPQDSAQVAKTLAATLGSIEKNEDSQSPASARKPSDIPVISTAVSSEAENSPEDSPTEILPIRKPEKTSKAEKDKGWKKSSTSLHSPSSAKSFDAQLVNWRMESIVRESESGSDDEFFDCQALKGFIIPTIKENFELDDNSSLAKWSSLDLLAEEDDATSPTVPDYSTQVTQKWWGNKRIDYALYCPEGLANFPTNALPHLFHASYWESSDVIAFIVRRLGRFDMQLLGNEDKDLTDFRPGQPREKWNKKRTSVKLKNISANHRANDVIVRDTAPQVLSARFIYGPIGLIALTGEKVDIHIMKDPRAGEWSYYATEVTDKNGRITYQIPDDKTLGYGLYPAKTFASIIIDANVDLTAKKSDITTFKGAFESVIRQHYPTMIGHIAIKFVSCPSICTEGLGILSSLSPYSFDVSPSCMDAPQITHDTIPIGAIPMFATSTPDYQESVTRVVNGANQVYQEFVRSDEGRGFHGQVCVIGDSVGSILAYDALCRSAQYQSRHDSENSILDHDNHENNATDDGKHLSAPSPRRRSSSTSDHSHQCKLEFDVSDLFMFGSPLSLVLAYRKVSSTAERTSAIIRRPCVNQVYNLFHPTDPVAARLEPLISARFSCLPPVNVARYQKYPLGNGQPYHLLETLQSNPQLFADGLSVPNVTMSHLRRLSDLSIHSTMSGIDTVPLQAMTSLTQKWWGNKRIDYALYCPEGLANFPTNALPHLFHASYWESSDVIAFIVRRLGRFDMQLLGNEDKDLTDFRPGQPREKWNKKRTSVKLKNISANHRANDVIVRDTAPQVLSARFIYGPIGLIALTGEKVDIHIMKDPRAGEWSYYATEVTDKNGRITYQIPDDKTLGYGLYPVKMVVRGDHTSVDFILAVIPPKTECVVFSIDGSFTASVSVTGRDPKVRAGAVDIVRHWQELGYLIIYITGRPDMQQHKVVSWLAQHNFPHGLVSFADGLSTDPLAHKAAYLQKLVQEHGVVIHHAYGSNKDISVYTSINLQPHQIFIVGKVPRKNHALATVLHDGYAAHLSALQAHGGSRPAQGNARMVIPRGQFGLPGQNASLRRRRSMTKRAVPQPLEEKSPLERSTSVGPPTTPSSPHQESPPGRSVVPDKL
ncbi:protein retinal degeneration B [Copidosoma floridanum]|uniref:protein retinal degeneration B n=1 Tax=Copidosoma floridanum TaxID=29053 RepID=UPI000C6FA997|nr:protein retinal degeneration B [Copidosoma floridanum]